MVTTGVQGTAAAPTCGRKAAGTEVPWIKDGPAVLERIAGTPNSAAEAILAGAVATPGGGCLGPTNWPGTGAPGNWLVKASTSGILFIEGAGALPSWLL